MSINNLIMNDNLTEIQDNYTILIDKTNPFYLDNKGLCDLASSRSETQTKENVGNLRENLLFGEQFDEKCIHQIENVKNHSFHNFLIGGAYFWLITFMFNMIRYGIHKPYISMIMFDIALYIILMIFVLCISSPYKKTFSCINGEHKGLICQSEQFIINSQLNQIVILYLFVFSFIFILLSLI